MISEEQDKQQVNDRITTGQSDQTLEGKNRTQRKSEFREMFPQTSGRFLFSRETWFLADEIEIHVSKS
ncbi:hypothetical protein [Leptospira interrogans]|uniref:hypothetical protein n=1 Tax=Leptospira interrogans TaxID=173 RepID=UPI0012B5EAF2|nr:hypothetical protein [Leptospira interrogans]UMQ57659.1 hypothetical protein FH585_15615 [Leptospira interrogans]UMQ57673.1 hypothetical protein FH585_15695 [Leptospira interrogans]UMQ60438.1 hypothetical protein FH585_20670 [Leptospira interrogans]UMQ60451.1 hypothetical protein FH585_20750 [Leptospira interrogans]UNE65049.1 hypothetical protein FH588_01840 [Leptospira interrogans]